MSDPGACDRAGLDAVDKTRTFALGSTLGLISGAALTAAGAVLFFTEPKSPQSRVEAHALRITGAALFVDPGGTTLGVKGSF